MAWESKIVDHSNVDPKTLLHHPDNYRVHSAMQERALDGAIKEIGFIRSVTVNKNSGRIIDGHLRVTLAIKNGILTIPVEYVDLTVAEEAEALATLDPIASLAGHDQKIFGRLREQIFSSNVDINVLLENASKAEEMTAKLAIPPKKESVDLATKPNDGKLSRHTVQFNKTLYVLTKYESAELKKLISVYTEKNQSQLGFWGWLCEGRKETKDWPEQGSQVAIHPGLPDQSSETGRLQPSGS